MEFYLNNKKYSIINHELFINYLMVDSYFRQNLSKFEYDIRFDFITPLLDKEKIIFEDILEGTKVLEELIEREEINFIACGVQIDEHLNGNFKISYHDIEFKNITVGEAVPLLITLNTLLNYSPIIPLSQIKEELDYFIDKFRSYGVNEDG